MNAIINDLLGEREREIEKKKGGWSYLCIKRFCSKYCIPSHTCMAKSHNDNTGKLHLNEGSLRHSSNDLSGASSVTSMREFVSKTTP